MLAPQTPFKEITLFERPIHPKTAAAQEQMLSQRKRFHKRTNQKIESFNKVNYGA